MIIGKPHLAKSHNSLLISCWIHLNLIQFILLVWRTKQITVFIYFTFLAVNANIYNYEQL